MRNLLLAQPAAAPPRPPARPVCACDVTLMDRWIQGSKIAGYKRALDSAWAHAPTHTCLMRSQKRQFRAPICSGRVGVGSVCEPRQHEEGGESEHQCRPTPPPPMHDAYTSTHIPHSAGVYRQRGHPLPRPALHAPDVRTRLHAYIIHTVRASTAPTLRFGRRGSMRLRFCSSGGNGCLCPRRRVRSCAHSGPAQATLTGCARIRPYEGSHPVSRIKFSHFNSTVHFVWHGRESRAYRQRRS